MPLVMLWPRGITDPRTVSNALVQSVDLYPTILEVAGVRHNPVDGRSLVPLFSGAAPEGWRNEILCEHTRKGFTDPHRCLRTADWKLIATDAEGGVQTELYDLRTDPFETTNVAKDPAHVAVLADMMRRLERIQGPVKKRIRGTPRTIERSERVRELPRQ